MAPFGLLALYAIFLWWFSTGVILLLNHLPPSTFRRSFMGATIVFAAAVAGVWLAARYSTSSAAYAGFTCALLAWGWQEMSFFMGFITGPRKVADPVSRGWQRMWQATETLLYHEVAIAVVGVAIVMLSAGHPNQTGAWTYLALWGMRVSAKLNVYLGVRNLNENWVPRRIAYLKTYMTKRWMNPLLPLSVLVGCALAAHVVSRALDPAASIFETTEYGLVGVILGLAVLEHVVMVLPLPFTALWRGFARRCPVGQDLAVTAVAIRTAPASCPHALERS